MELHLNEHNTIKGNLIVQDGEYLIVNTDHRTIARPEEIGYVAYRKQLRGFHLPQASSPTYDIELATSAHLRHFLERNHGEVEIYADENNMPLIYKNKIIIK